MNRTSQGSDFIVDIPSIGRFTFARRKMQDTFLIRGEYTRITNGNYNQETGTPNDIHAFAFATITNLLVDEPKGFSIFELDPLEEDSEEKIMTIFAALREQEVSFRKGTTAGKQAEGKGADQQLRTGVSTEV